MRNCDALYGCRVVRRILQRLFTATLLTLASQRTSLSASEVTISIRDNFFSPRAITVQPGDSVTWTNAGGSSHTTTSTDNLWDSGTLQPGGAFSQTFNDVGSFSYFCKIHGAAMSGTITVGDAVGGPVRDLFLVNLNGSVRTTNGAGAVINMPQRVKDFVEDCAHENGRQFSTLAMVYDVQADGIFVVEKATGSNVCTLATFMNGVTIASPDGSHRERQAFVMWEDNDQPSGSITGTERSSRRSTGELSAYSFRGAMQVGLQAYQDEPSKIFQGTFATTRRFIPTSH